jgi:hypothetical protein
MKTWKEEYKSMRQEAREWVDSRPRKIKALIAKVPPHLVYKLGPYFCHMISYNEDGTVTVGVTPGLNPDGTGPLGPRQVFGIYPSDLTPIRELVPAKEDVLIVAEAP